MGRFGWNTPGIHWRNASNPRLRRLAEERAAETWPELDDVWEEQDGTIEVYFGSTHAVIRLQDMNGEARSLFTHGYCVLLAYAIHVKTGLPLILFTSPNKADGWSGHAAISLGEDRVLDITGIRSVASVQNTYKNVDNGRVVSADEFIQVAFGADHQNDPWSFLDELERLIVEDFADAVIKTHKITPELVSA